MSPRSAALRRPTSPRRAAHVSSIGICISDAMLVHAIERYQRVAPATCRRINSHAGPLESRRRASKRHMTGLMPTSHASPPIWRFDVGPSTLQWEAPTSKEDRRQKRDQFTVSGLFNTFVGWLENQGSADKPFLLSPDSPSEAGSGVVWSDALAADSSPPELSTTFEQDVREPNPSMHLLEEIVLLRSSILDMCAVDDAEFFSELYKLAKVCRRSLRRRIERGDLSAESLATALDPLDAACRNHIPTAEMANKMSAMIRRGILYAMADVHKHNPAAISKELWSAFVDQICTTNGNAHDVQMFRRLLEIMPAPLKEHVSAEQIRSLTYKLVTAQAHRHNLFPHWLMQASRFGQALEQLPAQRRRDLDDDMSTFLSQQDWVSEKAERMRYAWLVIKAHDAHASTQDFIDVYRNTLGPGCRLNGLQRWHVIFARLSALQIFDAASRKQLMHATYTSQHERWTTLLAHAMLSGSKDSALEEVTAVLGAVGELASTARVLTFPPVHELRRDVMEALATACSNHKQALLLHDAIDMKPRAGRAQPLWSWTAWTRHVEAIVKDPAIDPTRVWQLLKLTYTPRGISSDRKLLAEENTAKSRLLNQMALWYTQAQHLNDRQVLRNLQRCLNMQRALSNGVVSSELLVHIVDLISRDLERGQRGRTSRMDWLLGMVSDKYGLEAARKAARAWDGWRWVIHSTQARSL